MKLTDKVTIVYWGDINSAEYPVLTVAVKTLKKYFETKSLKLNSVAFLLLGTVTSEEVLERTDRYSLIAMKHKIFGGVQ